MALNGGREILVGSRTYRWVFSGTKDSNTNIGGSPRRGAITIQADPLESGGKQGQYLSIRVESHVFDETPDAHQVRWGGTLHRATVSPGDIRFLIEMCRNQGWDPDGADSFTCPPGIHLSCYRTGS